MDGLRFQSFSPLYQYKSSLKVDMSYGCIRLAVQKT